MNGLAARIGFERFSGIYVLVLFVVIYSIWLPSTFPTATTAQSIAANQSITGVAALGLVCALAVGAFDLSVAAVLGLSSTVAAALLVRFELPVFPTIALVIAMSAGVGLLNAALVVTFRIPSMVATLGMSSVLAAFDLYITNGQFITPVPPEFTGLTAAAPFGVPIVFVMLIVIALLTWYLLEHTPLGRQMIATGAGPDAARLAGTNTGRAVVVGLVTSSTLGGVAGLMLVSTVGSAAPNTGPAYLLPLFAAVFLGSTQIKPGRFNVWGTVVALFILATGVKGLQLAGGQLWISYLFNGLALILAVGVAIGVQNRKRPVAHQLELADETPTPEPAPAIAVPTATSEDRSNG